MYVVRFLPHKMWAKTIGSASLLLSSLLRHSLSLVEHSITELNTIEFLHRIPIIHKYAQNSSYHDGCRNFWSDIQKYIRFKIRFEIFKVFVFIKIRCHPYDKHYSTAKFAIAGLHAILVNSAANSARQFQSTFYYIRG